MIFIFGHRLYGKVDAIPGVGHVATKFFHFDYVPLVPTESWLVTAQSGKTWRGVKIPLSAKSVFVAWSRPAAIVAAVIGGVMILMATLDKRTDPPMAVAGGVIMVAAIAFAVVTYKLKWFSRASYARACQVAKHARMNDHGLAALAAAYGEALPTFGFQPVMAPVAAETSDLPMAVEMVEDDNGEPEPTRPTAAAPLRGY